jgi:hypothetical protein
MFKEMSVVSQAPDHTTPNTIRMMDTEAVLALALAAPGDVPRDLRRTAKAELRRRKINTKAKGGAS